MKKRRVYIDYASTSPLRKEVLDAILPYLKDKWGNPSNLYGIGRNARKAVVESTETIADILNCRHDEFIYTGSATESDNLALAGVARANKDVGNRIIISQIEHKGIIAVAEALAKEGFEIIRLPVEKNGLINLNELKKSLNDKTILVSVTMSDSETGTLQPIKEIAHIIKDFRKNNLTVPYFHTDASQAAAHEDIDTAKLGIDLMTISAHKLGGPMGIGGLFIKKGTKIQPIIYGGGQQGRLRSGTENVPAIVGFAKAMELTAKNRAKHSLKIGKLRDRLEKGLFRSIPKLVLNGHPKRRLPNFSNISILDIEGEALLLHLDEHGIMVNTGSACNSESLEPSYVLTAIGSPYEFVHGSIRFTLGDATTKEDIDYIIKKLPSIVIELRRISPLNLNPEQKVKVSDQKAFIGGQTPHFLKRRFNLRKSEVKPPQKP